MLFLQLWNVKLRRPQGILLHRRQNRWQSYTALFQRTQILTAYHEAVLPTLILKETKRKIFWIIPYLYLTVNSKKKMKQNISTWKMCLQSFKLHFLRNGHIISTQLLISCLLHSEYLNTNYKLNFWELTSDPSQATIIQPELSGPFLKNH